MNEISHKQARFLVRQGMDAPLPEEQWAALQAHLERCAECRIYHSDLLAFERRLHHLLQTRWGRASGPVFDLPARVLAFRAERTQQRKVLLLNLKRMFILAAAVIVLWLARGAFRAPARPLALTPSPTPTATLPPEQFRGVLLFQSKQSGNSEIYLLNQGGSQTSEELTNLTQDPAEDTDPVWSPDGAWVAFLSNRSGKREVYVISVAGTRLTQLTSSPQIDWQGPLSWSQNGRWLTLVGRRMDLGGSPWAYLVSLTGSGPVVVPGTRGASGPLRMITQLKGNLALVYPSSLYGGSILRANLDTGQIKNLTQDDNVDRGYQAGVNGSYEYAELGNLEVLLYLAEVIGAPKPGGSVFDVKGARQIRDSVYSSVLARTETYTLVREADGPIRSMSRMLNDDRILYLQDSGKSNCWRLHMYYHDLVEPRTRVISDLCVDGDLDRSQYTPDGRWIVLLAHAPQESTPSLFAVRMPDINHPNLPDTVQKLADGAGIAGLVQARPSGRGLAIQPGAVVIEQAALPASTPPAGLQGEMVLSVPDKEGKNSQIVRLGANGKNRQVLVPADAANRCPVWSPDRSRIAFVSDRAYLSSDKSATEIPTNTAVEPQPISNDVYLINPDGSGLKRITTPNTGGSRVLGSPTVQYECPVWSPDGKYLATFNHTGLSNGVMVFSAEVDGLLLRYGASDEISTYASMAWMPDDQSLLLAQPAGKIGAARIVQVPWRSQAASSTLLRLDGWEDVQALSISPDGKRVAMMLVRSERNTGSTVVELRIYSYPALDLLYYQDLEEYNPLAIKNKGRIFWQGSQQVVFAYFSGPIAPYKATILRYNQDDNRLEPLVSSPDALFDWALSGDWLVYSSESGLWGANIAGIIDPYSLPIRLGDEAGADLSLR